MDKLWVIAYKDIRTRFTDRTLLMIMIAAPLVISTIIGLAFGGLGRSASPITNIPVAVVNFDQSTASDISYSAILTTLLTTGQLPASLNTTPANCPQTGGQASAAGLPKDLINGSMFDTAAAEKLIANNQIQAPSSSAGSTDYLVTAAKAAVDKDIYNAVVIIPENFSASLNSLVDTRLAPESAAVTIYGNAGESLPTAIVQSVVGYIVAQMSSRGIAQGASLVQIAQQAPSALAGASGQEINDIFACAFSQVGDLVKLASIPVQAAQTSTAGTLLVTFGSAQALFFALFVGQNGILSMYEERRNGTLQRILVSPTPRWAVLAGKLVGVFVSVLFQLFVLAICLTLVGSILEGRFVFIWGSNLVMLGLLLLAVAVAVSGLGMLLAGIIKGIEQANVISSVLNIALGVLGGAFGFQLARSIAQFSLVYWARNAFDILAAGRGDITLNLLVLFIEGAVMFGIGLLLFNRKFEM
jgi:ABC-2 type transport system permease protein